MNQTIRCLAWALAGAVLAAPALAHTLQGRVLDATSLDPIPLADVVVHVINPDSLAFQTASDGAGNYVLADLPPDNEIYVVICTKPGYQYAYTRVDGLASGDVTYDILLDVPPPPPPPGEPPDSTIVSGRVLSPDALGTLQPVPGATVALESGAGQFGAVTDAQGAYLTWVDPGTYSVTVTAAGHEPLDASGVEVGDSGVRFDAVLKASSNVGVPPGGGPARLWLDRAWPNPVRESATLYYSLTTSGDVRLELFDAAGRRARTLISAWREPGRYTVTFGSGGLPTGTYFCRLSIGSDWAAKALQIIR